MFGKVLKNSLKIFKKFLEFFFRKFLEIICDFSCIYDMSVNGQTFELSLAHKVVTSPVDTITFEGKSAEGKFRASMELFKNDGYKKKDSYRVMSFFDIQRIETTYISLMS